MPDFDVSFKKWLVNQTSLPSLTPFLVNKRFEEVNNHVKKIEENSDGTLGPSTASNQAHDLNKMVQELHAEAMRDCYNSKFNRE